MAHTSLSAADTIPEVYSRGAAPSVVESFGIYGLYGYRTVSLSSPYAATILIAQNGSGKTTLLGALDAFLKRQFSRLRGLPFDEMRCKLRGIDQELILYPDDVEALFDISPDGPIARFSRQYDVDTPALVRFLLDDFESIREDYYGLADDKVFVVLQRSAEYRRADVLATAARLREELLRKSERIYSISKIIDAALSDTEILYLPTYRRIELPVVNESKEAYPRRKKQKFRISPAVALYSSDIQFGVSDIHEKLADLNQKILAESNLGYRQISASIINELIDGTFEGGQYSQEDIPDKETLELFFSRLKEGPRMGPFSDISVPDIDKIYSGADVGFQSTKTLRYFLSKLNAVIQATTAMEKPVDDFVSNSNKYLVGRDESVALAGWSTSQDQKILKVNRRNLQVHAHSLPSGRRIPLDALSSGEKQMISLFSRLFLYPKKKIVLIDEPELSLSLDWQRHILPDVVTSSLCQQVIAITHSPFVFDNELEPFAKSLTLLVNAENIVEPPEDEESI